MYCSDDVDDGVGLPVQLPPTKYERTALCKCKPRPTPPPPPTTPPPIKVFFKEASYSNDEGLGIIAFTIQASQASEDAFSVEFSTQNSNPVSAQGNTIMPLMYKAAMCR